MDEHCNVKDCESPKHSRGICAKHYRILRRDGVLRVNGTQVLTSPAAPCSIEHCSSRTFSSGLCSLHYSRQYHYGDPNTKFPKTVDERFWSKVEKTDYCWLWTGHINDQGKGIFGINQVTFPAHRYAFMKAYNVKLTKHELLRQRCGVGHCVRPDHQRRA